MTYKYKTYARALRRTLLMRRLQCHGSLICCQYTDQGMCNTPADPHISGRLAFAMRARKEARDG